MPCELILQSTDVQTGIIGATGTRSSQCEVRSLAERRDKCSDAAIRSLAKDQQACIRATSVEDSRPTTELSEPDLLPACDHSVGEVVQAEAGGHLQGKVAYHQRQEGQDGFRALGILIVWVHWGTDDGC